MSKNLAAKQSSTADVHEALFPGNSTPVISKTLAELKEGIADHVRAHSDMTPTAPATQTP